MHLSVAGATGDRSAGCLTAVLALLMLAFFLQTGATQAAAVTEEDAGGAGAEVVPDSGLGVDEAEEGSPYPAQDAEPAGKEPGAPLEAAPTLGDGQAVQRVVIVEETITETIMVAPAATGGDAAEEAEEQLPRRKRRKLLTGMAVVWKHFGFASTDGTACEAITAQALPLPPPQT